MKKTTIGVLLCLLFCLNQLFAQDSKQLLKDLKKISSDGFQGRKTGTIGNQKARDYIVNRFKKIGLTPFLPNKNFVQNFPIKDKVDTNKITEGRNILGYVAGNLDSVIVVSAHYDHLGMNKNGDVFNGADDNASGVAALLHFAEYFVKNKPNYTFVFAAFDAEEMGLLGAKAFLKKPPVEVAKIKMNINMDMIAHNDKGELYAVGTFKYPELKKYFLTSNHKVKILFGHDDPKLGSNDWTNQSDQGAFNAKNIPFIYFGVEDHKDYHQLTDEFKNINQTFFINVSQSILEIIKNIDTKKDIKTIFRSKLKM
ncbi:MAG: M28 family peptidase [Sphingobacteriaceae bacterium]|nr:M28 family peptidase [Sphingobacteriaceae bacterium]